MGHPPETVTLSVVIPVYNEVPTIATLIARVQAVPLEDCVLDKADQPAVTDDQDWRQTFELD